MFDWKKYQVLAQKESELSNEENRRSAISRSYYSSYCVCRNKILESELADKQTLYNIKNNIGNVHKIVCDVLEDGEYIEDSYLANSMGSLLKESRFKRNSADYDDTYNWNLENDVYTVLKNTDYILENIDFLYKKLNF